MQQWLRRHTLIAGLAFALGNPGIGAPGIEQTTCSVDAPLPAPPWSLKALLDTALLGSAATYRQLGLQAGSEVHAFYAQNDYAAVWTQPTGWNEAARAALALLRHAPEYGLDTATYAGPQLRTLPDSLRLATGKGRRPVVAGFELRLTDALLRYAAHLGHGRLRPGLLMAPPLTGPPAQAAAAQLRQALLNDDLAGFIRRSQPQSRAYSQLQAAWLAALQAACPEDSGRLFTGEQALFRRVAINLERLRWEAAPDSAYALVNIPAYRLQLIRQGRVLQTHRVVVGKPETPTPTLDSRILVFVTSPEWRVPYSIAVKELLPLIQDDPGYLADNNYTLLNAANETVNPWRVRWSRVTPANFSYTIHQAAGPDNALGKVVFYFPNRHAVFMHDTPGRLHVFNEPMRALSHGCVRIENPLTLATYLLQLDGTEASLRPALTGPDRHTKHRFDLQRGLPVHFRYYTCEGENGRLRCYPDIYQQDAALGAAFFKQP